MSIGAEHGIVALLVIQLGKTAREWLRDRKRHRQLLAELQSAVRKGHRTEVMMVSLIERLQSKGVLTPCPIPEVPTVLNELNPMTVIAKNPLLKGKKA